LFRQHLIWVILAILVVVGIFVPGFLSSRNILNVMWAAAPLGAMVLGMFFVMLVSGLDLSLESTFAFAPTLGIMFMLSWLPGIVTPVIAVVLTLVFGALVGLLNGFMSVKLRVNPFLITLGTLLVMRGFVIYLIPEGVYYLPEDFTFLGRERLFGEIPIAIAVFLGLYVLGHIIINKHSLGKSIYAIGNNEEAAFVAGINIVRVKILTFVFAGLFAAVGGLLEIGRLRSVVADLGEGDILMVFAAAILGGTSLSGGEGRVTGVFAAVLVIAIIENLMNLGVEPSIRQVLFGLILLAAIFAASLQKRMR
jgi:ribose/xylose/arabinose/galactoside ABC-type transport system permease subunit